MKVYIKINIYKYTSVSMDIYICIHGHVYTYENIFTYIGMWMSSKKYIYIYIFTYMHKYICIYMCISIRGHI